MNKTKFLSLSLAAVLLVGSLAGCKTADDFTPKGGADSGSDAAEYTFNYSALLNEEGGMKGIKALDYVTLGTYSGISVPKSVLVVSDEALQEQIDNLLEYFATYEDLKDGTVADQSTVNIDYVGMVDGVAFDGGSTKGAGTEVTIGVTQYIDGFLSQLVGHKVGESFDINVTFPTGYDNAELAGKDAVFSITINSLKGEEKIYPELTDEFVKENLTETAGYTSVQNMKDEFTKELATRQQSEYVWNTFIDGATVKELPQDVLDFAKGLILSSHSNTAMQYGISFSDYLTAMGLGTVEDFGETQKESIKTQGEIIMTLLAVAEKEGMTATEEKVKETVGETDAAAIEEYYGMPYIKYIVITTEAEQLAINSAVVAAA